MYALRTIYSIKSAKIFRNCLIGYFRLEVRHSYSVTRATELLDNRFPHEGNYSKL